MPNQAKRTDATTMPVMNCRVCERPIDAYGLTLPAPALSSIMTRIDADTNVAICEACGHAQGPAPMALDQFYDEEYRISLQSDDFDQLYQVIDGKPVFRTDRQLKILLGLIDVRPGMRVLDFGAAKAQSLKKLVDAMPGLDPHVFDVSDEYREHWATFLRPVNCASYEVPQEWIGRFDLVTSYFVLEHVAEPVAHLSTLRSLLAPGGRLFLIVPDVLSNIGDLLVVDHVNHFTADSLRIALGFAGLRVEGTDSKSFTGAIAISAVAGDEQPEGAAAHETLDRLNQACRFWARADVHLDEAAAGLNGRLAALHGAGFYGAFVNQRVADKADLVCALDNNPHLQGGEFFGLPVVSPREVPEDVSAVFVALNPLIARQVAGDGAVYGRPDIERIFLGD